MKSPWPRISVFPKCYFDELYQRRRSYLDWIVQAAALEAEGLEHYDGFFDSLDEAGLEPVRQALRQTGQVSSLLCFSPDFTHPDPAERAHHVERQKKAIDACVALGIRHCRTLSGQRYPGLSRREGISRTVEGIRRSLEYAEQRGVVLCLENHYKDGTWQYAEFAQPEAIFLEIIDQIHSPCFGVQYDPSNATVGGFDPLSFLDKVKHRVVSMHASDRYLAPGATLEDLRQAEGAQGYSEKLKHGETGKGLNDYDTIFRLLAEVGFSGWISVEDGMDGMDQLRRSVQFLKAKRQQYYRAETGGER
jgi:sugar phosphate isomerase/epimerase